MPVPEMDGAVQLNVVDFKEMIHQVAFSASTDEARPVLMGVLMNIEKDKVTMAAADGFRLSVRKAQLSQAAPRPINIIIPARALNELARVATDGEEVIQMVVPKQRARCCFASRMLRWFRNSSTVLSRLSTNHPAQLQFTHADLHRLASEGLQAGRNLRA